MKRRKRAIQEVTGGVEPSSADLALAEAMMKRLRAGKDLRLSKVRRLKTAIRRREYENSLKMDVALDRVVEAMRENPS